MTYLKKMFPVSEQCIYLNHAAVSPWPQVTSSAVEAFSQDNLKSGSLNYPQWLETEASLRKRAATLINAPSPDDIALVKNTSEGISFVADGLNWSAGDNVVGIQQEFPSNRFAWLSLNGRGVEFRALDLENLADTPEIALMQLCDERTRVLAISAIQFSNGLKLDLKTLGEFCQKNSILFCVDAIQQIGALPFDVEEIKADFAIADGHKWMLGPEGLGIMYVRKERLNDLKISQFGWHMVEDMGNYTRSDYSIADSARRFECGSPNMLGIHALNASLGLLLDTGMDTVSNELMDRSDLLREGLKDINGVEILSDESPARRSGIITFRTNTFPNEELIKHLQNNDVFCAQRGGGIRLSPHYYTPLEQVEQVLKLVDRWSTKR